LFKVKANNKSETRKRLFSRLIGDYRGTRIERALSKRAGKKEARRTGLSREHIIGSRIYVISIFLVFGESLCGIITVNTPFL